MAFLGPANFKLWRGRRRATNMRLQMSRFDSSLLVLRAGTRWKDATTAAFLDAINDGTLPPEAFNRWLVQDYHFADTLTSFQAIAAAKTPRQRRESLIVGLGALDAEVDWFEAQVSARGLEFNAPVHDGCRRYCDFLIQAAYREPYPVLLAMLFGVEASYLTAWSRLSPRGPYAEFIDRWSNARFGDYVESLRHFSPRTTCTSRASAILMTSWSTNES